MLLLEPGDFGTPQMADGRSIRFYTVYPIYTEERDLERTDGIRCLIELFQEHDVDTVVDLDRPNVARLAEATDQNSGDTMGWPMDVEEYHRLKRELREERDLFQQEIDRLRKET